MSNGRCRTCAYWDRRVRPKTLGASGLMGDCSCPKWEEGYDDDKDGLADGVRYSDYEDYRAFFYTGEDFGCIHYKEDRDAAERE